MVYTIQNKPNYKGEIQGRKYNTSVKFYEKKQMKTIYPNRNYRVVGEIGNKTGVQCGAAENLDGKPLPVYKEKTHNVLTESVVGYTSVDDHTYLAIVKNVLLKRVLIIISAFMILSIGTAIGIFAISR